MRWYVCCCCRPARLSRQAASGRQCQGPIFSPPPAWGRVQQQQRVYADLCLAGAWDVLWVYHLIVVGRQAASGEPGVSDPEALPPPLGSAGGTACSNRSEHTRRGGRRRGCCWVRPPLSPSKRAGARTREPQSAVPEVEGPRHMPTSDPTDQTKKEAVWRTYYCFCWKVPDHP